MKVQNRLRDKLTEILFDRVDEHTLRSKVTGELYDVSPTNHQTTKPQAPEVSA